MISDSIRRPGSYTEIVNGAAGGLPLKNQDMLIIAPRVASGSAAAHVPTRVYSAQEAAGLWGAGSIMHRMVLAALRQNGQLTLYGCAVNDAAAGVAAAATITLAGTAAGSGAVTLWVGADRVTVAAGKGDAAAAVAAKLAGEITANFPNLPVTASASGSTVTLTAKNKGVCGLFLGQHGYPVVASGAAGIDIEVTPYAGGAVDPDIADALAAVAGQRFHIIAIPFTTTEAAAALSEHLANVSSEINQLGGRGFMFVEGSLADAATLGAAVNDKRVSVGYIAGTKRPQFENAAAFAAMQAAQPAPWLATNNLELVGCDAPGIDNRLGFTEINGLLWNGITPFAVGAGDRVRCVRAISTYVRNGAGVDDDAFLDSFKIATADYVREAIRTRHLSDFPNKVLRDNHVAGEPPNVVTPADVRSANLDVCRRIEREGGLNNVNYFAERFTSVRDPNVPGRVNSEIPIDIVDAAHIMANTLIISSAHN